MGVFRTGYIIAVLSAATNLLGRKSGWVSVNFKALQRDGLFAPNFKALRRAWLFAPKFKMIRQVWLFSPYFKFLGSLCQSFKGAWANMVICAKF